MVKDGVQDKKEFEFFRKTIENTKTNEESFFTLQIQEQKRKDFEEIHSLINQKNLKIEKEEDFKIIVQMLKAITMKAVVKSFQYKTKEQARKDFLRQIEFLKYGIWKTESEDILC